MPIRDNERLIRAYRLALSLGGTCVGLLAVLAYLLLRPSDGLTSAAALQDPAVLQEVVARLVEESKGVYDSHVDTDVGRVQLPGLRKRKLGPISISTNRFGIRERAYTLPKPADTLRVVILGDSMVFSFGVAAEDRLGEHLGKFLRRRSSGFEGRIECLHIGTPSWNIKAEAAYLRRQLSELQPDLVVHIIVPNDISDCFGVRGFGQQARFSTQVRHRADSLIGDGFPMKELGFSSFGYLRFGIDYEGRARYRAAAAELRRLAEVVERAGSRYRLLVQYRNLLPIAYEHLGRHLDPDQVTYISRRFGADRSYTIARNDPHWNREGHLRVAKLLYGLITRDNLLPRLRLSSWDEADKTVVEIADAGRREAERIIKDRRILAVFRLPEVSSSLETATLDDKSASQIHGGVDRAGRVSPYASILLKNPDGKRLRIEGSAFPRPELDGAFVRVFVDGEELGQIEIEAGREIALVYPLPAAVAGRPYLSVRFEADDYVYAGPDLQHCVVFQLARLAIEA